MANSHLMVDNLQQFDFESQESCEKFLTTVRDASDDQLKRDHMGVQVHRQLCQALSQPLKSAGVSKFLQVVTELLSCLPLSTVVHDKAFQLSMDQDGSRLLQACLQAGDRKTQAGIVAELRGHACEMLSSPHANHVLQKLVELMPPKSVSFILDEIANKWTPDFIAKHKFGCRVLERIIEHFSACPAVQPVLTVFLNHLLENAAMHSYHAFSTFIMQHILEHGSLEHKQMIISSLRGDLEKAAMDSHASGVLDKGLSFLPLEEQLELADEVLSVDGLIGRMALANKPAAERLLRIVSGTQLVEAERQLSSTVADNSCAKVYKSLLEGKVCRVDSSEEQLLPEQMSMGGMYYGNSQDAMYLTVPHQQQMMCGMIGGCPVYQQPQEEDHHWWHSTVNQVQCLWTQQSWADM